MFISYGAKEDTHIYNQTEETGASPSTCKLIYPTILSNDESIVDCIAEPSENQMKQTCT
jgi:hypothetical protein